MDYLYKYERPALAIDCVIFGFDGRKLKILLVKRGIEPFKDRWALPGGFVNVNETIDEAAQRELKEETGVDHVFMEQLYTFGSIDRDPRERVVSVAYFALVRISDYKVIAGSDASNAQWFTMNSIPSLAFDHSVILEMAINRIKGKIRYQPIGFELLDDKFTIPQLQAIYESILERKIDRRNFYNKIKKTGLLIFLDEKQQKAAHRAATLVTFDKDKYLKLKEQGYAFEI